MSQCCTLLPNTSYLYLKHKYLYTYFLNIYLYCHCFSSLTFEATIIYNFPRGHWLNWSIKFYFNLIQSSPSGAAGPLDHRQRTPQPSPPWPPPLPQRQPPRPAPGRLAAGGHPPAQLRRPELLLVCVAVSAVDAVSSSRIVGSSLLWVCAVRRR